MDNLGKLRERAEDRGAQGAAVHGVPESRAFDQQLNNNILTLLFLLFCIASMDEERPGLYSVNNSRI